MADAVIAARARIDRALATLERKVNDLKTRSVAETTIDDDLFAIPTLARVDETELKARIAELEQAGREASSALAQAADELRLILGADQADDPDPADPDAEDEDIA